MNTIERALWRLAGPHAVLVAARTGGGFAIYPNGDRRRRPTARLSNDDVRVLESDGVIAAVSSDVFALTEAGRAHVRRNEAQPGEAFAQQHRPVIDRAVMYEGVTAAVRGHDPNAPLRRLEALKDAKGEPWLTATELAAAQTLHNDWERAQAGLVRGSDLTAPPLGGAARGPGSARERLLAAHCDARRRVAEALDALAPPLRRIVEAACLQETGLHQLERTQGWPARSAKLALKMGLAQLAVALAQAGNAARAAD